MNENGLTLLELVVGIAIVGVTAFWIGVICITLHFIFKYW